jgi:cyclin A
MKRDDLESLSQSSKKRAGPLQDVTNMSRVPVVHQKASSASRVTRSMTSSDRKKKSNRDGCDTVVQNKTTSSMDVACSALTTRKISQSFAQASIHEAALTMLPTAQQPQNQNQNNVQDSVQRASQSTHLWKDIDAPLRSDMRMCTDYVNDVYTNAQIKQLKHSPNPQYMELHQKEITVTMRGILVDWLVEVAVEYQQSQETLFLSIGYIDAYLSKARCVRSKLQLVGITCMHIASKYQEIYPPSMNDFCYITDNTYDREDLISMERRVLSVLDFELSVPTTWMFLMRFLRVGEADRSTEYMGMYLAELSLLEYNLLQHLPSQVAASAVLLALYNNHKPHWSTTLEHYTGYTPRALKQCVITLHKALREARPSTTLPAIGEKYSKEQTGSVSSLAVRELNLAIFDQPY